MTTHYTTAGNYLEQEELWLLLTEKFVRDPDRKHLINTPSFQNSGIVFSSDKFVILKIDVLYCITENRINIQVETSDDHWLERKLQKKLWEHLPDTVRAYPFIYAGEAYMLINFLVDSATEAHATNVKASLYAACRLFVTDMLSQQNLQVRIYVSPFISSIDKIGYKFETLCHMAKVEFQFQDQMDIILPPDDSEMLAFEIPNLVPQLEKLTRTMITASINHNFPAAQQTACKIVDLEASSYDTAVSLAIRMSSRVECLFDVLGIPPSSPDNRSLRVYAVKEALLEATSILIIKEVLNDLFASFEEYFTPPTTIPLKNRIDEICTYIQDNYADSNLCSDMICSEFKISGAYLSRLFKEQMGLKLIDYIHTLRIQKANALLNDTSLTIEQIAHEVGYQSALTLTRAYKRYYDILPSSVRKK